MMIPDKMARAAQTRFNAAAVEVLTHGATITRLTALKDAWEGLLKVYRIGPRMEKERMSGAEIASVLRERHLAGEYATTADFAARKAHAQGANGEEIVQAWLTALEELGKISADPSDTEA